MGSILFWVKIGCYSCFNPECNTERGFKNQLYIKLGLKLDRVDFAKQNFPSSANIDINCRRSKILIASGVIASLRITMVSVSTVQPSINLVFLCTDKNLKMPLYTLLKVSESTDFQIWKVMHEIIAEWWKEACRTMGLPWYFLRVERPLCYFIA